MSDLRKLAEEAFKEWGIYNTDGFNKAKECVYNDAFYRALAEFLRRMPVTERMVNAAMSNIDYPISSALKAAAKELEEQTDE